MRVASLGLWVYLSSWSSRTRTNMNSNVLVSSDGTRHLIILGSVSEYPSLSGNSGGGGRWAILGLICSVIRTQHDIVLYLKPVAGFEIDSANF